MGFKKSIGKFLGAVALGATIYTAGVVTSDSAKDAVFYAMHPTAQIEAGYDNINDWHEEKFVNSKGNIEAYLVNEKGYGLPCLQGQNSMQLGNDRYVIQNLKAKTKPAVIANGYNSLPEKQRLEIVVNGYDQLSAQSQDVLADELMSQNYKNKWDAFKESARNWWDGIGN